LCTSQVEDFRASQKISGGTKNLGKEIVRAEYQRAFRSADFSPGLVLERVFEIDGPPRHFSRVRAAVRAGGLLLQQSERPG
jgi:hypothetical protein